jgi:hypothetical protein
MPNALSAVSQCMSLFSDQGEMVPAYALAATVMIYGLSNVELGKVMEVIDNPQRYDHHPHHSPTRLSDLSQVPRVEGIDADKELTAALSRYQVLEDTLTRCEHEFQHALCLWQRAQGQVVQQNGLHGDSLGNDPLNDLKEQETALCELQVAVEGARLALTDHCGGVAALKNALPPQLRPDGNSSPKAMHTRMIDLLRKTIVGIAKDTIEPPYLRFEQAGGQHGCLMDPKVLKFQAFPEFHAVVFARPNLEQALLGNSGDSQEYPWPFAAGRSCKNLEEFKTLHFCTEHMLQMLLLASDIERATGQDYVKAREHLDKLFHGDNQRLHLDTPVWQGIARQSFKSPVGTDSWLGWLEQQSQGFVTEILELAKTEEIQARLCAHSLVKFHQMTAIDLCPTKDYLVEVRRQMVSSLTYKSLQRHLAPDLRTREDGRKKSHGGDPVPAEQADNRTRWDHSVTSTLASLEDLHAEMARLHPTDQGNVLRRCIAVHCLAGGLEQDLKVMKAPVPDTILNALDATFPRQDRRDKEDELGWPAAKGGSHISVAACTEETVYVPKDMIAMNDTSALKSVLVANAGSCYEVQYKLPEKYHTIPVEIKPVCFAAGAPTSLKHELGVFWEGPGTVTGRHLKLKRSLPIVCVAISWLFYDVFCDHWPKVVLPSETLILFL